MAFKAFVEHDFVMGVVRVWVVDVLPSGDRRVPVRGGGLWAEVSAGLINPPDAAPMVEVRDDLWPEISRVILADVIGDKPDAATEAKAEARVLREWLAKEQARVDAVWNGHGA